MKAIDLTNITTPFGLLDAETQAALKAHGGPYEVFGSQGWMHSILISPVDYYVYRVKPQPPTKPSIDWSHVAPEYKWLARDGDGCAFVFERKPLRTDAGSAYCNEWSGSGLAFDATALSSYTPGTCDWRDSLVERPADV